MSCPNLLDDATLRAGRRERKLRHERVPESAREIDRVRPALGFAPGPFERRSQRDREELVEDDPFACTRDSIGIARHVHVAPRLRQRRETELAHECGRERVDLLRDQTVEILGDDGPDGARRQLFGRCVDRDDLALVTLVLAQQLVTW